MNSQNRYILLELLGNFNDFIFIRSAADKISTDHIIIFIIGSHRMSWHYFVAFISKFLIKFIFSE